MINQEAKRAFNSVPHENDILRFAKYDLETDCGPWGFLSGPNFSSSGETPRIGPGQFLLVSITGLSFGTTDGSLTLARVSLFLLNLQTHIWGCGCTVWYLLYSVLGSPNPTSSGKYFL